LASILGHLNKNVVMTADEIKELEKEVAKARFALGQKASQLHDLIEDELPGGYQKIPEYAESTYQACKHWDELNKQLLAAKK